MNAPFTTASSPGRLDVMGGIADYSGSLVLQLPLRESTEVSVRLRDDFQCTVQSEMGKDGSRTATVDIRHFLKEGVVDYDFARRQFRMNPEDAWTAYVLGTALVLQKEKGIDFRGADFRILSTVPIAKGVSSSASLEVAVMKALGKIYRLAFAGTELPLLAQRVENEVAGAPCGLMDQLACFLGQENKLLPILCQPDMVLEPIPIPDGVHFMGIDSGIRHAVGGSSYSDVRCAAFMGYSIIAKAVGASAQDVKTRGSNNFPRLPFQGYLANIPVEEFEFRYRSLLPECMSGKEFLSEFGGTIDHVTQVSPDKEYAVLPCTRHPVYENERVHRFRSLLLALHPGIIEHSRNILLRKMGQLMVQSHESYSRCGLGSKQTDEVVALAIEQGGKGIFGAKITGGGSGGTVCLLAAGQEGKQQVRELHRKFSDKYDAALALFEP